MYKDKSQLRSELALRRKVLTDKPKREKTITSTALSFLRGNVLVYVSMGSEVSTVGLISELLQRRDTVVFAPYTTDGVITAKRLVRLGAPDGIGNLSDDCYGGTCVDKIDFCVTPLLGFNDGGYRIGYGRGCYDRYFKSGSDKAVRVGLAFDCQRVDFVNEPHDVPLDCCITESGVVYFDHACHIG